MATNTRRAGLVALSINGTVFDVASGLHYSTADTTRETLRGQSGVQGFKEMPQTPFMEATLRDDQGITLSDFVGMTNVTVVATLANGKSVSGSAMWWVGDDLDNDTEEGTFKVRFEGLQVEEST